MSPTSLNRKKIEMLQAAPGRRTRPPALIPLALALAVALAGLAACAESPEPVNFWALELGDPEVGRKRIEVYGCPACHTIPGVPGADALVGPPLNGWSERTYIAGQIPNEPDNLVAWIMDPPSLDEDTAMPDLGVAEADARDIAAYLYTLGEGPISPDAGLLAAGDGLPAATGERMAQPVPFSHQTHAGELALDCRFCHDSVTESTFAGMPSTQTCMTCHSQVLDDVPILAAVRLSWENDAPIPWVAVTDLDDHVHFDHAAHVNVGVGCDTCHSRVDQMEVTEQAVSMTMSWCLDCHRDPAPHLRPPDQIFNLTWTPPPDQPQQGAARVRELEIPLEILTDCSLCHY